MKAMGGASISFFNLVKVIMINKVMTNAALNVIEELENMPEKEFREELELLKSSLDSLGRERDKKLKPNLVSAPDLKDLRDVCIEYIDFIDGDDYHEDNDYAHYIFEAALETVYGKNVWNWINKRQGV